MKTSIRRFIQHFSWLEILVILLIFSLLFQAVRPRLIHWWQLPRPGAVGIDYLPIEFFQQNPSSCLAPGYVCYLPARYSQDENWPLLILLHGAGERGMDAQTLLAWHKLLNPPHSVRTPAVLLLPQCLPQHAWQPQDIADLVTCACRYYRIDRQRIYLMGYSMGGYGTWATAAEYPGMFAAIVPIAGGGDTNQVRNLAHIPTWAFHGAKDKAVNVEETRNLVDALRTVGGKPKLTVFPNAEHGILGEVLRKPELWRWLLQQNLKRRRVQPHEEHTLTEEHEN